MDNKPLKLTKNFDHYTLKEKMWIMKKQQFIRAEFHDKTGTIRSYYTINLATMITDDPPGFTITGKRYNIDMDAAWVDATNKITYLRYTQGIPDPDTWTPIQTPLLDQDGEPLLDENLKPYTKTINIFKRNFMDAETYYTRMLRHQSHNLLTRGEEEQKVYKIILLILVISVINILFTFINVAA